MFSFQILLNSFFFEKDHYESEVSVDMDGIFLIGESSLEFFVTEVRFYVKLYAFDV